MENIEVEKLENYFELYEQIVFFGAGGVGKANLKFFKEKFQNTFNNKKIVFSDNNKCFWSKVIIDNIKCLSIEKILKKNLKTLFIISVDKYKVEIYNQLKKITDSDIMMFLPTICLNNFEYFMDEEHKNMVYSVLSLLDDKTSKDIYLNIINKYICGDFKQLDFKDVYTNELYFPQDIIRMCDTEIFVDIGGFVGDTINDFIKKTKGCFEEIHSFEIDEKNYKKLENYTNSLEAKFKNKINLYNIGLWNKNTKLNYEGSGASVNITTKATKNCIEVDTLDRLLINKNISFIKMDIEGAEIKALEGAKEIIKKYKPKLAISIYHNPKDLIQIPIYLKKLLPEYKIYIRHHSLRETDTVCYAVYER